MKNLKKLVSVIVTVAMLISSFAAIGVSANGEYGDVAANNSYYKAIKVLSGLGVVKGDDEGNFNPTNDIKRSEMVALVCRAVGDESVALASGGASFDDVSADHWAAGYIAWGVAGGIVNGVGDNKFDPDAPVKFQDAVVMALRALGYERIANRDEHGGYPTGYMKIASQRGLLAGASFDGAKAATREVVAQVIYNAMTAPVVEISKYGATPEDDEFTIYDGVNASLKTVLSDTTKVYKMQAEVLATAKTDANLRKDAENPMVKLDTPSNDYKYGLDRMMAALSVADKDPTDAGVDYSFTALVGDTEIGDYMGYTVEAYVTYDEDINELVVLAAVVDTKSVVTETIVTSDVTGLVYNATNDVIEFYANENATRKTKIELASEAANGGLVVYYNNGSAIYDASSSPVENHTTEVATGLADLLQDKANTITFLRNKSSDKYTKVFVTNYDYKIVDTVNADDKYITYAGGGLDLDAVSRGQEETFVCNIYDADGNAIDIADIKEDDVLNIVAPLDDSDNYDLETVEIIDIYVTNATVEGAVTEDVSPASAPNTKYVIDGDVYTSLVTLNNGDEGIFYLTIDGLVLNADTSSAISNDYAFIVASETKSSMGESVHYVQLFTAEGELVTYPVASTLKVTGAFDMDGAGADTAAYGTDTITRKAGQAGFFGAAGSEASAPFGLLYANGTQTAVKNGLKDRIITYKLNSNNELMAIAFAKADDAAEKFNVVTNSGAIVAGNPYYADTNVFASQDVNANSKLFIAPVTETAPSSGVYTVSKEDLKMASFDALDEDNGSGYEAFVYMTKNNDYLGAAVIPANIAAPIKTTHLAVVKSKSTGLDAEGLDNVKYTFVQSGETITLAVTTETVAEITGDELAMTAGDVFRYTVNGDGEIDNIQMLYDASTEAVVNLTLVDGEDYSYSTANLRTNKIAIVFGNIDEIKDGKMTVTATYDHDANIATPEVAITNAQAMPKLTLNTTEGNTYASVDEAMIAAGNDNGVKVLSGYGSLRASVDGTAKNYFVLATIGQGGRYEDCVMIIKD